MPSPTLTETGRTALERIQTLRTVTHKTGIQTYEEQNRLLMSLENADMLLVADALGRGGAR